MNRDQQIHVPTGTSPLLLSCARAMSAESSGGSATWSILDHSGVSGRTLCFHLMKIAVNFSANVSEQSTRKWGGGVGMWMSRQSRLFARHEAQPVGLKRVASCPREVMAGDYLPEITVLGSIDTSHARNRCRANA